jgi:hypothetical protein
MGVRHERQYQKCPEATTRYLFDHPSPSGHGYIEA